MGQSPCVPAGQAAGRKGALPFAGSVCSAADRVRASPGCTPCLILTSTFWKKLVLCLLNCFSFEPDPDLSKPSLGYRAKWNVGKPRQLALAHRAHLPLAARPTWKLRASGGGCVLHEPYTSTGRHGWASVFFHCWQCVSVYLEWQTVKDIFKKMLHSLIYRLAFIYYSDVGLRCVGCPHWLQRYALRQGFAAGCWLKTRGCLRTPVHCQNMISETQ